MKEVLNEKEVAAEYGLGVSWLRKMRRLKRGPVFLRIHRMIKYRREDVEAFLIDHIVATTESDEGN